MADEHIAAPIPEGRSPSSRIKLPSSFNLTLACSLTADVMFDDKPAARYVAACAVEGNATLLALGKILLK
jgi:hypothetical protein